MENENKKLIVKSLEMNKLKKIGGCLKRGKGREFQG